MIFNIHLVPGGTVGASPLPNELPYELLTARAADGAIRDWTLFSSGAATITNAADIALGLAGWRSAFALGAGVGDLYSLVGMYVFNPGVVSSISHIGSFSALIDGSITDPVVARTYGYYYLETDARLNAVIGSIADFAFFLSPSWIGNTVNGEGFKATQGFGICWANSLGPNYNLFVSTASLSPNSIFIAVDTGIPALDGVSRVLRVEWGWDDNLVSSVIRAVIDGVTVAEILGPLSLDTTDKLAAFSHGICCGIDRCDDSVFGGDLNSLEAFFGTTLGIRTGNLGAVAPIPPPPIVPSLNPCSVITPIFFGQSAGAIPTFQPCSGTGQPNVPGQPVHCG